MKNGMLIEYKMNVKITSISVLIEENMVIK